MVHWYIPGVHDHADNYPLPFMRDSLWASGQLYQSFSWCGMGPRPAGEWSQQKEAWSASTAPGRWRADLWPAKNDSKLESLDWSLSSLDSVSPLFLLTLGPPSSGETPLTLSLINRRTMTAGNSNIYSNSEFWVFISWRLKKTWVCVRKPMSFNPEWHRGQSNF